jgi:hypothetical protein
MDSKKIYITNLKLKNLKKINKNNSNDINNSLLSPNDNKKPSISKDIAILCKIINSINSKSIKNISRNYKNGKKIIYKNSRKFNIAGYYKEKKIIKIQKWWRKILYQIYIEKKILIIQRLFRRFLKMKKKRKYDYQNQANMKKIINIQKVWRKYMKNKYLNNYYFFSFKKYMKPNKKEEIINNNIYKAITNKDKIKSKYYISKLYYKNIHINYIIHQIKKLQKKIKQFIFNNKTKNLFKNIIYPPVIEQSYITKVKKYRTVLISKDIITKTSIIQKNVKKYFMSKMSVFTFSNNNDENEQMIINAKKLLGKKFSNYISYKLSKFFMLVLNQINIFTFIKMFHQRIKKNINQYVFIKMYCYSKKKNTTFDNNSFFFQVIWRHIKINIDTNNEISLLLKKCIPKYFLTSFSKKYIPYIDNTQEEILLNTQLFLSKDDELVKYIFYFYEKEKLNNLNINTKIIKNHLIKYNLKNRNIFGVTRYIDSLYKDFLNKKLNINIKSIKEKGIHLNNLRDLNDRNDDFLIEDNCYNQTEENVCDDNDDLNNEYFNTINTDFAIKRTNNYYNTKNFNCKFIDYLNKSKK